MARPKSENITSHVEVSTKPASRDALLVDLATLLNKENKDGGKVAFFLDEQDDPSTITDWISTGSSMLDLAISNRPHGGLPVGRCVEFNGLESCVTEDTKIKVIIEKLIDEGMLSDMNKIQEITVGDVKELLKQGRTVKVLTRGNKFTKITNFVEKGILNTFKVMLEDGRSIKVSKEHRFFTNLGWVMVKNIIPSQTKIFCEDGKYYQIKTIEFIGKERIVDVTVEDSEHCYFGNGMLNHNTGKSLLSAHICAETQKKGGRAIVIDTESSAAPEFWASLGVDLSKLLYIQRETVEEIFETMESAIAYVRKNNKDTLLTIIVDSVAGASTKKEQETSHGVDGYNTGKAIIISKAMRKITNTIAKQKVLCIFTNQLREKMNAMAFGDKYTTPGGKGLAFHCSVRVRLSSIGKLKSGDVIVGNKCLANVIKNRMGPPFRKAEFNVYYDSGIADYASWLNVMKSNSIDGCSMKANELVEKLNTDSAYKEELYQKICQAVIMKYKTPNSEIKDDVTVDSEDEDKNEPEE